MFEEPERKSETSGGNQETLEEEEEEEEAVMKPHQKIICSDFTIWLLTTDNNMVMSRSVTSAPRATRTQLHPGADQ